MCLCIEDYCYTTWLLGQIACDDLANAGRDRYRCDNGLLSITSKSQSLLA